MKLLIDIPEHIYEHAKETTEDSRDEFDAMRAIANGSQQESRSEIPNTCSDTISRQAVLNLKGDMWKEKSDVTDETFRAVAEYCAENNEVMTFSLHGKRYKLMFVEVEE